MRNERPQGELVLPVKQWQYPAFAGVVCGLRCGFATLAGVSESQGALCVPEWRGERRWRRRGASIRALHYSATGYAVN